MAKLKSSVPDHEKTLWRSQKNISRLTFACNLQAPTSADVEILELLPEGWFGPDLSGAFTFDVENDDQGFPRVLRFQDTGATLEHGEQGKWYEIRNANWNGVDSFQRQYLVEMGDCDNNGIVISLDVGCVNAGIPCFVNCGDDSRKDIDGDGRVISLDVGVVNAHIGSFGVPKPSGH